MSKTKSMPGQLDFSAQIEALLRSYSSEDSCPSKMDTDTTEKPEKESYVDLGIRLMTMARNSLPMYREITDLQEKIFSLDYSSIRSDSWDFKENRELYYLVRKIAVSVIRPMIRKIKGYDCEEIKQLNQLTPFHHWNLFTYDELKANEPEKARILPRKLTVSGILGSRKIKADDEVLYFTMESMSAEEIFVGSKMETHPERSSSCYFTLYEHMKLVDFGMLIALLFVIDTIRERLLADDFKKSVVYKDYIEHIKQNYGGILPDIGNKTLLYMSDSDSLDNHMATLAQAANCRLIFVSMDNKELFDYLKEQYPEKKHEVIHLHSCPKRDFINNVKNIVRQSPHKDGPIMVTEPQLWIHFVLQAEKLEAPSIHKLFSYSKYFRTKSGHVLFPLFNIFNYYETSYEKILCGLFLCESALTNKEIERKKKAEKEQRGTMARSFETKKNIPKSILALMESSILNKRFGYIEFDEMCDKKAIDTVSHQILDFVTKYFPKQDLKLTSLRFRRLGNWKASGLYFPFFKCICVDINSPGSFVHEFGHLLDYENDSPSDLMRHSEFKPVYDQYVHLLEEECKQDQVLYKKLNSSRKYNLSYYTKEREVFARCFEIFIASYVKLDNSLIKDMAEKTFAYPQDELFIKQVCDYFLAMPCMEAVK